MTKLRILLADDHGVLRDGLTLLINAQPDMQVVASARGGREAVQLAVQLEPQLVVLDVSMPDLDGAEAAEQIRGCCPGVRILALTRYADQGYLRRLLDAGASGYVLKRTAGDALIDAIRVVAEGGSYIDPTLAGNLFARMAKATGVRRDGRLPRVELSAPSIGLDHQVTASVRIPMSAAVVSATKPSLVASQRVRVTLWFHASRCVPASSSRATSGAPQKAPRTAGANATTTISAK